MEGSHSSGQAQTLDMRNTPAAPATQGRQGRQTARATHEVVVITGASAGVGRATVRAFARRGAWIGLLARGHAGLEAARAEVEALGGRAIAIPTDVADAEQVEAAAAQVEEAFGPIDIWVNDAMTSVFSPFKEMTNDEFKRVTEVTYLGFVYGTKAALKRMIPRNHGVIVQVGSALAYRGIPLQSGYCGSKHAIQGFTESVRTELMHDHSKVRITMVQMPALNTPQFNWVKSRLPRQAQPVPPIYQPEVAAEAIYFAAHHKRRQIYVGLSTVIAIWGNNMAPWLGDWYLSRTGYKSQQTDQLRDPRTPNNLYQPVDDAHDYGAHGRFDQRATSYSKELWLDLYRPQILGATLATLGVAALGALAWRNKWGLGKVALKGALRRVIGR